MNATLTIRSVASDDFVGWKALWDGYNSFYGREGPTALAPEITETTWARFFDAGEPVNALVADDGSTLVGLAHYIFHRSTTQIALTCYLQDLFTAPAARGRGVGSALIEAVYQRAAAEHTGRVYWQTHETNRTAIALYEKLAKRTGFIVYRKTL